MGACATKPGDLKVKGEAPAPLLVEDAAAVAPLVVSEEKADVVQAAAEADPADAGRRRSLSDLLKQEAETSDGEAGPEAEKAVAVEPASASAASDDGGAATIGAQAAVQESSAATEPDATADEVKDDAHGDATADEVKDDAHGDGTADELKDEKHGDDDDVQAVEEEKRVDPGSVQVAAVPPPDAAAPSAEESKVADDASSA